MNSAWITLLITAFTDFLTTAATGLIAAMMASGAAQMPSLATVVVIALGGLLAAARTIQQALKASPSTSAELKGLAVTTTTVTPDRAITVTAPPRP